MIGQWIFYICICLYVTESAGQGYTITPITTSSGLYYEKIGEVLLSNNNWEFVTSVDYAGYLLFYEYLHKQANELHEFCQTYKSTYCQERFATVRTAMDNIDAIDEILANFLGIERKRRVKRFWLQALTVAAPYILEPLGKGISKSLFGSIDEPNLQMYDQQISALHQNQLDFQNQLNNQRTMFTIDSKRKTNQINFLKRTQDGIKNDLKVLQSTISLDSDQKEKKIKDLQDMLAETKRKLQRQEGNQRRLSNDVENIKNKLVAINADIESIKDDVLKNKNKTSELELQTKLNAISINLMFLLSKFETEQRTLLSVIKNANRGELDPYIITPLNLIEMLEKIYPSLPEGNRFPFRPNFENAKNLYNIIKPTVYLFNNKILFILQIPLVETLTYNLYKITSLPMSIGNNKFIFILPKQPYLLIDNNDEKYAFASSIYFREFCTDLGKSNFLCNQVQKVHDMSLNINCEVQLFLNRESISDNCNARVMKLENSLFIQLQQYKSWIYVIPGSETIILTCNGKRENQKLSGTGFLRMNTNCTARISTLNLKQITGNKPPTVFSSYNPNTNLATIIDLSHVENFETKRSNDEQIILPFELEALNSISTNLKNIVPLKSGVNNIMLIILILTSIALILLLIVIFRNKICRCGKVLPSKSASVRYYSNFNQKLNNENVVENSSFKDFQGKPQ